MIPVRDVIPSPTRPLTVLGLIAAQGLVFLYVVSRSPGDAQAFLTTFGVVPAALSWPTLATSLLAHGGWVAALANLLFLWLFGPTVEDRIGHGRFLALFLVGGVTGALVPLAIHPLSATPVVGAGPAVAGIIGAHLALYPRSRILLLVPLLTSVDLIDVPAPLVAGFWLVAQVAFGAGPWSLVAGCVAGAAALYALRRPERLRVDWWEGGR